MKYPVTNSKRGDVKKLRNARKEAKTHIAGITNAVVRFELDRKINKT